MASNPRPEVVIHLSRTKLVLAFMGCVGFVLLSLWLWGIADSQKQFHPLWVRVASALGVGFFGPCGVYLLVKLLDRRPGLVLNDQGIFDNSSALAVGWIPWSDVVNVRAAVVGGQRCVAIDVRENAECTNRGGMILHTLRPWRARWTGSPVNLSHHALDVSCDDLLAMVKAAFERHGTGRNSGGELVSSISLPSRES